MESGRPIETVQADYALNLLRQDFESTVIFPFSMAAALAMTYGGADGETKEEIKAVLAGENDDSVLHDYLSPLFKKKGKSKGKTSVESANRIFVQSDFEILSDNIDFMAKYYDGNLEQVDFKNDAAREQTVEVNKPARKFQS
ncbi:hypothetical protein L596_029101 [Steinernema carpocapsae]|uniref:Serpin domain-containing protein n=1 Tax=Steinernema carpocapsae TaxID=34508 RepID=A0A4U5LTN0_STECR|nr:hypothetical protein L596_029101 [Steinernema carpocapsae]